MMIRWSWMAIVMANVAAAQPVTLRVATFNVEDVRTSDLKTGDQPRLKKLADVIQHLRPNIILLNEIAYDTADGPDVSPGAKPGLNGQRFADLYLAVSQSADAAPMKFKAFMAATNTGMTSGKDLDKNGEVVMSYPALGKTGADGKAAEVSAEGRAFGGDCWGFGSFPGQYGMALLVDERLTIQSEAARTFRLLPWDYVPSAALPKKEDGSDWFTEEDRKVVRLSSKSHWDVPVKLPNGTVLHLLCSHPTPPVFDGPEKRNARRNHDEIRFWADYIEGEGYIVDDANKPGGLADDEPFVILGDLNADPKKGDSWRDPVGRWLFANRRVNSMITPKADIEVPGLAETDTSAFKLRVDYVLPSKDVGIADTGIWRHSPSSGGPFPSDHYPVWMEIKVESPPKP